MVNLHIDTYYDLSCENCAKSWSSDFCFGMSSSKEWLRKAAKKEGWRVNSGKTLCPECARKHRENVIKKDARR